ncbi:MAG: MurR/RpiR family transcriptional regulator [Ruminiclostridium sp.]|nr:MurR/RpiR family transcriptional regulator [Ruminiclostridium sp.]
MSEGKDCLIEIRSLYPSFYDVERKIADFITKQQEVIVHMTVAQISKEIGVADSSIVRFCQKLGFNGFTQLKINVAKNLKQPDELLLEDIDQNDSAYEVTAKVFSSSIQALTDTIKMLDRDELDKAVEALLSAGRIEFYGVGTSATIAMDMYYRFMRIGMPAYVAVDPHISKVSASMLDDRCVAVGISHTGRTKDTIRTLQIAKSKGAKIICITSYSGSPIFELSDIKLVTSTVETRFMKEAVLSRIAQIALLDSLYTCIALRKYEFVSEKINDMTELLNEMRYE